jgi:Gpi18-like mannosyltransferase
MTIPSVTRAALGSWRAVAARSVARPRWADVALRDVALPFVVTRLLLASVGLLSIAALPVSPFVPAAWTRPVVMPLFDAFARWDGIRYLSIATNGYPFSQPFRAAFFPLYPALVHAVGVVGGHPFEPGLEIAALIVSNVALLAAVATLIALCRLDYGEKVASRAAWYLLLFPTSFFLSAAYADSLFLALSLGAMLMARRDRWLLSGLLGGLAALTRPFGFAVAVPIAVEAFLRWREGQRSWRPIAGLAMIPLALSVYVGYLGVHFHDPLAFVHAQAGWHRSLSWPWQAFMTALSKPLTLNTLPHSAVDLLAAVLTLGLVAAAWKLLRRSYALYLTVLVLLPLSTGSLGSLMRFDVSFFPILMVVALAGRYAVFDRVYVLVGAGLGAVFMALFAQWYWVA